MKRILLAIMLLWAAPAFAQPEILRPISHSVLTPLSVATPITSTQLNAQTNTLRMFCTVSCIVAVVVTPIVVASSRPVALPANIVEYFRVSPGQFVLVHSGGAGGGQLFINEMSR